MTEPLVLVKRTNLKSKTILLLMNTTSNTGMSIEERKLLIETATCIVIHSGNILHELLVTSEEVSTGW